MVREICDRHGILLIADEVITAFGRTGSWTGSRHWQVQPDLMCTAKAITNGYFPFGAVMLNDRMAEAFENDTSGKANIGHGYTYSGHPVGAAAAIACLHETERLQVHENAGQRGAELHQGLLGLQEKYDLVGDVRGGEGLMCALEIVSDRTAKTPIDKPDHRADPSGHLRCGRHGPGLRCEHHPLAAIGPDQGRDGKNRLGAGRGLEGRLTGGIDQPSSQPRSDRSPACPHPPIR